MMNRVNLAKSVVAARDIAVGDEIDRAAIDIKSPAGDYNPTPSTAWSAVPPCGHSSRGNALPVGSGQLVES